MARFVVKSGDIKKRHVSRWCWIRCYKCRYTQSRFSSQHDWQGYVIVFKKKIMKIHFVTLQSLNLNSSYGTRVDNLCALQLLTEWGTSRIGPMVAIARGVGNGHNRATWLEGCGLLCGHCCHQDTYNWVIRRASLSRAFWTPRTHTSW